MPTLTTDIQQRLREAVVEAFDNHADIVAITGRRVFNVIPFRDEGKEPAPRHSPRVQYAVLDSDATGGTGDGYDCLIQFSAFAAENEIASALVRAISKAFSATLFAANANAPVRMTSAPQRHRRDGGYDADKKHYRQDLDVTVVVQQEP